MLAPRPRPTSEIFYPESDGKPLAENTKSAEIMVMLKMGLEGVLPDFVAIDLFWYPVQGHPEIVAAPDVLVARGRPKGHRPSYKQWEEGGVAPSVAIEIWSPSNTLADMVEKYKFYERHGVQEFYAYNPDTRDSTCYVRKGASLELAGSLHGYTSALLGGVRFEIDDDLRVYGPNGERFLTDLEQVRALLEARRERDEARRAAAEAERARGEAEQARGEAEQARVEAERARVASDARADVLLARLRAAGLEPDSGF